MERRARITPPKKCPKCGYPLSGGQVNTTLYRWCEACAWAKKYETKGAPKCAG